MPWNNAYIMRALPCAAAHITSNSKTRKKPIYILSIRTSMCAWVCLVRNISPKENHVRQ